jgi:FlaA1/EpsC-like NDP-sugar epimerase
MLQGLNEDLVFPLLLRRPQIVRRPDTLASVTGRRVMITGAGGSIGSELALQVAELNPARLILVDQSEYALYEVNCTLAEARVAFEVYPALADIRHAWCMGKLFEQQRPDIVFHAAALKHVPLLENDHNLIEAVRTNVLGSHILARFCAVWGVGLVMVSTDKAVHPASVMGLTKRAAEIAVAEMSRHCPVRRLSTVRFGNVLGSSGSVVPLFRRQIAQGGPVTVTHADMTRFFMSIKEAVSLVLQASTLGPALYVLDMGQPVKIFDLARHLIEMAGLRLEDIGIEIIGLRPGEKLHEQLHYEHEILQETAVAGIRAVPIASPNNDVPLLLQICARPLTTGT